MKKLTFLLCLISVFAFAQPSGYRYGKIPEGGGPYQVPNKEIINPAYAATSTLAPTHEETIVDYAQLTGDITVYATLTSTYKCDKLTILFTADATDRTVTFSTGFASLGTLLIPASNKGSITFHFNGTSWLEIARRNLTGDIYTDNITEKTSGACINFSDPIVRQGTSTSYTANATVTASELAGGLLTVTSGTLTLTLPTARLIPTQIGAVAGTIFDFVVNNSASGGTVTVAVGSGITASGFPGTNTLTLANSATIGIATFRITFISATVATLTRIS